MHFIKKMKKIALMTHWHPFSGGGKYAFDLFKRFKKKYRADMIYFEYPSFGTENQESILTCILSKAAKAGELRLRIKLT